MRPIDENTGYALTGSRSGDELVCWVWRDGQLALEAPLPIASWSLSWDGDGRQKVQGSLNLTVKDPDGKLGPWLFEDPLGVGGSRVKVHYRVGGAGEIKIGDYRVDGNTTEESWQFRIIREDGYVVADSELPRHRREVAVPMGSSVSVTAKDLTLEVDSDGFIAPEQPVGSEPTVMSEVERLIADTVPVIWNGVTDTRVPRDVVWEDNRLEAVMDLLDMVGASHRMTGDGAFECYVKDTTPVFTVAGGDDGILINCVRQQSLNDVYNVGVVTSTMKTTQLVDGELREVEVPLVGSHHISSGPLAVGGPFGRRVIRQNNPLMDSQTKVDAAARTLVLNRLASQTVDLDLTCLPNPAVQVGDFGTIEVPVEDGREIPLVGEVVSMSLSGQDGAVGAMSLVVRCLQSDAAMALKGFSIAEHIGDTLPPITYDTVNPMRTLRQMSQQADDVRD